MFGTAVKEASKDKKEGEEEENIEEGGEEEDAEGAGTAAEGEEEGEGGAEVSKYMSLDALPM